MTSPIVTHGFISSLAGLRGIAVLLVMLHHFFPETFPGGFMGVDIFFALSGYLVTRSVLENLQTSSVYEFLNNFYTKRVARIFPGLLFYSIIALAVSLLFYDVSHMPEILKYFSSSLVGATNVIFHRQEDDYFSKGHTLNFYTQTWSLGVEEQFYLLFSLIICIVIMLANWLDDAKKIHSYLAKAMGISTVLSLIVSIYIRHKINYTYKNQTVSLATFSFYMLPARWWELSAGSFIAIANSSALTKRFYISRIVEMLSFTMIGLNPLYIGKNLFRIPDPWGPLLECQGKKVKSLDYCLRPTRTEEKPLVLFINGDTHAAQLVFRARKALKKSHYDVIYEQ